MSNPNNKPAFNNDGNVKKNKGRGSNNNNNSPRNPPPSGRGQQPNKTFNNNTTSGSRWVFGSIDPDKKRTFVKLFWVIFFLNKYE